MERIVTYNIHGAVGTDRRYDPRRIVRVLREISPSIVGLQEVWRYTDHRDDVISVIHEEFPEAHVLFLKTLTDHRGSYGNALVTRHEVLDHLDLSLDDAEAPDRGRTVEARRAIFARIRLPEGPVWVIVTHLAVEGWARPGQARILLDAIDEHIRVTGEPIVLMGDLNEWRKPNPFLRQLDRTFSRHLPRRTFPSRFPVIPLDRIWLSHHLNREKTWVHRNRRARRASDHLPLCLECQRSSP
ncbi:MAG: endonuclease/exonuclease/phosphatase family protein [Alkalispirochaeta sp.]